MESAEPWPAVAARDFGKFPASQAAVQPAQAAGCLACCHQVTPGTMPKDQVRVLEVELEMSAVKVDEVYCCACPVLVVVSDMHGQPE